MKYILLLVLVLASLPSTAQELSWKEHEKLADQMIEVGKYAQAADNYEMAWNAKPGKMDILTKAADAYRLQKEYRKAAELYKTLLDESNFDLAGLYYGRMLKQLGQYQDARKAFQDFIDNYSGVDKAEWSKVVQRDIRGCGLAQEWSKEDNKESDLKILSEINTDQHEFAPLPFADDILYFSSTQDGAAKILRTQKKGGSFSTPVVPNLPRTPGGHFCHGTFTPDNERFYFTVCNSNEAWTGNKSKCKIYVTMRENNSWSVPQSMRDYVIMDGTTATHPFVYHDGDTEILYFVSDRSGGKGGLDIWYMTRQIAGKDIDFTYPVNAGSRINTPGDEVTPFYNQRDQKMYFSSNGHVNIGGLDIFMVEGEKSKWTKAKNLELPYNSSSDDYYFVQPPGGSGAYFVSNRSFDSKNNTTNDDLFFYGKEATESQKALVSGKIFDKNGSTILTDVEVSIYEKIDNGEKRLLTSTIFADGNYEFPILGERVFVIEANKEGYSEGTFEFNTQQFDGSNPGENIFLDKASSVVVATPPTNIKKPSSTTPVSTATSTTPLVTTPVTITQPSTTSNTYTGTSPTSNNGSNSSTNYTSSTSVTPISTTSTSGTNATAITQSYSTANTYTNSRYKNDGVTTSAPKHQGEYFKVQLAVVIDYDLESGSFLKMQDQGRLDTEYIISMGWTRVLLADYFNLEEARRVMEKARLQGYPEAFIVRYVDGYRKN